MSGFDMATQNVMRSCGWEIRGRHATLAYRTKAGEIAATASVRDDGAWTVRNAAGGVLAFGNGPEHPAGAACDANEAGWAERDRLERLAYA